MLDALHELNMGNSIGCTCDKLNLAVPSYPGFRELTDSHFRAIAIPNTLILGIITCHKFVSVSLRRSNLVSPSP